MANDYKVGPFRFRFVCLKQARPRKWVVRVNCLGDRYTLRMATGTKADFRTRKAAMAHVEYAFGGKLESR